MSNKPRCSPNKKEKTAPPRNRNTEGRANQTPTKGATPKQISCQKWFKKTSSMGFRGIRSDFIEKVKTYHPELLTTAFNDEANFEKNRYDDVLLLDKTRVKIHINPDDDYIHASVVKIRPDLSFICAQGPLSNTVSQFWYMCIQEDVKVILQMCLNVENEKEKCSEYLPPKEGDDWTFYGNVQVKVLKTFPAPATKKVTMTNLLCKHDEKEYNICHILYYGWPDHSVPESLPTYLEVRSLVYKLYEKKPVVLHCSAGIGRTGTFAAVEMACHKLLNECNGDFSMIDVVQDLRKQRIQAVQNDQQYSFIFRAVVEVLIVEEALSKTSEVTQFIKSYDDLVTRKKKQRSGKGPSKTIEQAE